MNNIRLFILALIMLPMVAIAQVNVEEKTKRAIALIDNPGTLDQGLKYLKEASQAGSHEAMYRLGWLHLNPKVAALSDNDIAYDLLNRVKGDYEVSAKILIGVIYALGSKKIDVDLKETEKIFNEVKTILFKQMEYYMDRNMVRSTEDMNQRNIMYENFVVLKGYSKEYGIKLKEIKLSTKHNK